jgi:hypothetical protein
VTYDLSGDQDFLEMSAALVAGNGLLMDCWFEHKDERWYPVVMRDQRTAKHGFDVNCSGKWGEKTKVGRCKLTLHELLVAMANGSIANRAFIRCKRTNNNQRNGRVYGGRVMSARMAGILRRLRP